MRDPRVDAHIAGLPEWHPDGLITGGHENTTARTIAYRRGDPIRARPLAALLAQVVANNRAGGWRKLEA